MNARCSRQRVCRRQNSRKNDCRYAEACRRGKAVLPAAGFLKPHLPFNAPKKYWDLYRRDDIDPADNPFRPKGAPDAALHNWGELRAYYGIPQKGPLSEEDARKLIHGYYACTSYTDAQVGKLLNELDRLSIRDNTVVILWGTTAGTSASTVVVQTLQL